MVLKYSPAAGFIVTKLDAARRQLDTAIELWFHDGDPVSVHTLTAAAHRIVFDLAEHRKLHKGILDAQILPSDQAKDWKKAFRQPETFFKHAKDDPEKTLKFDPRCTEGYLLDATATFQRLHGSSTILMAALRYRFFIFGSPVTLDDPFPDFPELMRTQFRQLDKARFLDEFLRAFHSLAHKAPHDSL